MDRFFMQQVPYKNIQDVMTSFIFYVWLFLDIFGIISNLTNITVFVKMGLKDNVTITLLILSMSDLAFLMLQLPTTVGFLIQKIAPGYQWPFSPILLTVTPVHVQYFFYYYSSLVSAFLALVRCMCVAKPLQFKSMFTVARTFKTLLVMFLINLVLRVPIMTSWRFIWIFNPQTNSTFLSYGFASYNKELMVFDDVINIKVVSWAVFAIVSACAAILSYKLRQASKFRNSLKTAGKTPAIASITEDSKSLQVEKEEEKNKPDKSGEKLSARDVQIIKAVTLVCVVYILAQIPTLTVSTTQLIEPQFDMFGKWTNLYRTAAQLDTTCSLINASFNILIYLNYNTKFRTTLMSILSLQKGT